MDRKKHVGAFALMVAVLGIVTAAPAQTTTTSAPSTNAVAVGMTAYVEAVTGNVRIRKNKDAAWEPAVVGMELREGSEIRTGLRSAITCSIPPDQEFTLDRLGTMELSQAVKQGNLVKTDLTMKYGRAQYRIEKAGLDHDASISSPGSTLAVRGTTVELEDSPPFKTRAVSYTGRARFTSRNRTSAVGAPGGGKAVLTEGALNAANVALLAGVIDPQFAGARTPADQRVIAQQTSSGATARFDRVNQILVVQGGPGPAKLESELVSQLPGRLSFVARWTTNSDVNVFGTLDRQDPLTVLTQGLDTKITERIYPGFGLDQSKSGGRVDFDHRGGSNGGQEIIYWKNRVPTGIFGFAVSLTSGEATDVTLNAFLDGQKLPLFAGGFPGEGPTFTPALNEQTVDIPDVGSITFLSGKSTTFSVRLEPTRGTNVAAVNVYLPLDPSLPQFSEPDLNNGAAANLPTADRRAPNNAALKTLKLRPASQTKGSTAKPTVTKKTAAVKKN